MGVFASEAISVATTTATKGTTLSSLSSLSLLSFSLHSRLVFCALTGSFTAIPSARIKDGVEISWERVVKYNQEVCRAWSNARCGELWSRSQRLKRTSLPLQSTWESWQLATRMHAVNIRIICTDFAIIIEFSDSMNGCDAVSQETSIVILQGTSCHAKLCLTARIEEVNWVA